MSSMLDMPSLVLHTNIHQQVTVAYGSSDHMVPIITVKADVRPPRAGVCLPFFFFSFFVSEGKFSHSLLSKLLFKILSELSIRFKKNRFKPSPLQLGHTVELIVVAASEALRKRVILNLQLCNLGTEFTALLFFFFFVIILMQESHHKTHRSMHTSPAL